MTKKILFSLGFLVLFSSCSYKVNRQPGEYILWKQQFSGNKLISDDELMSKIALNQRENKKPFNLPITPGVYYYSIGKKNFDSIKTKKRRDILDSKLKVLKAKGDTELTEKLYRNINRTEKKVKRLNTSLKEGVSVFYRYIGEPLTIINEEQIAQTEIQLQKYLETLGFLDAEVSHAIKEKKANGKIELTYSIKENTGFTIDSVFYIVPDHRLDSLFKANLSKRAVKSGDLFDIRLIETEKNRLKDLATNEGYYGFSSQYIFQGINNVEQSFKVFKEQKHGNLYFEVKNPSKQKGHKKYTIDNVVFKAFDPNLTAGGIKLDTLIQDGVKFITPFKKFPYSKVTNRITTKHLNLFKQNDVSNSVSQLASLNQFAGNSPQFFPKENEKIDIEYFAPLLKKYTFSMTPSIKNLYTDGQNFIGASSPVNLSVRNLLNRFETLDFSITPTYEYIPSPLSVNTSARPSSNLSFNTAFNFPELLFFNNLFKKIEQKNPRTRIGVAYNYNEPYWAKRRYINLFDNYSYKPSQNETFTFSLLDVNLINTEYTDLDFFNNLLELQAVGNNFKTTIDPQFVSSISANYVNNNQDLANAYENSNFFRLFLESGGTFMNLLGDKDSVPFIEKYFPLGNQIDGREATRSYFRYLKVNVDFRQNFRTGFKSSVAYKLNIGVANPYGSNKLLPYEKNFFAGGSNSIRAWEPRSLGTGSSPNQTFLLESGDLSNIQQPGNILLEASLEYRKKVSQFAGYDIQLAAFLDAGNVWLWHNLEDEIYYNKSNFTFNRFYKEIALGTGAGVRWDLGFFVARLDWGIKVIDPSQATGNRFVLDDFKFGKYLDDGSFNPYKLNLNFGIGYPF